MIQASPGWDEIVGDVPEPKAVAMQAIRRREEISDRREDQAASLACMRVQIERRKRDWEEIQRVIDLNRRAAVSIEDELGGLIARYDAEWAGMRVPCFKAR